MVPVAFAQALIVRASVKDRNGIGNGNRNGIGNWKWKAKKTLVITYLTCCACSIVPCSSPCAPIYLSPHLV